MTDGDVFGDSVYESGDPVEDADNLDLVESLSGDDPDETTETGYSPPEREPYILRHLKTGSERSQGESLDERLAEEEPDISVDDESDLEAEDLDQADIEPRAGRLVAPDEGVAADKESEAIARDVGPAGYASSAEEAAVHIIDEDDDNEMG